MPRRLCSGLESPTPPKKKPTRICTPMSTAIPSPTQLRYSVKSIYKQVRITENTPWTSKLRNLTSFLLLAALAR